MTRRPLASYSRPRLRFRQTILSRLPCGGASAASLAVPVGLLLVLLTVQVPVVHAHQSPEPSIFNGECPLSQLAASPAETTPSDGGGLPPWLSVAASVPPGEPRVPPAGPFVCFASRAPPIRG